MHSTHEAPAQRGPRRAPVLKIAVYAAAVILLLAAAFFTRGFSRDVGDGRVAGRFSLFPVLGSRVPEELTLTWNGLALHFTRSMSPALAGIDTTSGSTDLLFDGDVRLRLTPGTDAGGSITLSPVGGASSAGPAALVVPYSVAGVVQDPSSGSGLSWKRAGRTFLFTLPRGARSNPADGTVTLPLSAAAWTAVLHVEGVAAAARAAPRVASEPNRLPAETAMPGEEKLQSAMTAYVDAAYNGWSDTRYAPASSQWSLADGSKGVSEDLGVGLLAESVSRGTWQKMSALWSNARALHDKESPSVALDAATSAYVGGVRDYTAALQTASAAIVDQAGTALDRSDTSLLLVHGLVPVLVNHGTTDLVARTGTFLAGRTVGGLDIQAAEGLADALVDYCTLVRREEALVGLLKDTINRKLLPAMRTTDSGLFLETGPGTSDVLSGVFCGGLLLRGGTFLDSSLLRAVGRALLVSSVSLADEKGFLPASVTFSGGRVKSREGTVAPEVVYPMLPLGRCVPRETTLASQLGPGSWVWTSARVAAAAGTAVGSSFTFAYPVGIPFNVIIRGVAPFTLLKLHGIPWHSDPTYFKYSDGWTYDPKVRTLYLKITGKSDQETIDITS
jgi:hypothetical protein